MKKVLLIAFSFLLFTACSDDDSNEDWLNFSKPDYLELTSDNLYIFSQLDLTEAISDKDVDYNNIGIKSIDVFSQMTSSQKTKKLNFSGSKANPYVAIYQDNDLKIMSSYKIEENKLILGPYKENRIVNKDYTSVFKDVSLYGSISNAGNINRGRGLILKYTEYSAFHNVNITYTYKGDFNN